MANDREIWKQRGNIEGAAIWQAAGKNLPSLQNLEMTGKYGNRAGKYEVENCQITGEIWKQRRNIKGTASYSKWQDVMTSDRKL